MSLAVSITRDDASPALQRLIAGLTDRTRLHRMMANRAENITRKHLRQISRQRHATARRLGAKPTGHLGRAAESVSIGLNHADAATVTITSPGISRVAHDLDIKPVNGQWLTIPIHALAYGKTAREVSREIGVRLFRPGAKGRKKNVLAAVERRGRGGKQSRLVCFFALSKHVRIPQDRTLLPSDTQYKAAGLLGARDFVRLLIRLQKGSL